VPLTRTPLYTHIEDNKTSDTTVRQNTLYLFIPTLLLTLLSSCSNMQEIATLENLPLPTNKSLSCCWQAQQQLNIFYDNNNIKLQAVIALTQDQKISKLALVLLDPLGRRLLSIDNRNTENTQASISIEQASAIKTELPAKFLLASAYLAYWPLESWDNALNNSPWSLTEDFTGKRILSYQKKPIIDIQPINTRSSNTTGKNIKTKSAANTLKSGPTTGETLNIEHRLTELNVEIHTLIRQDFAP